MKIVSIPMVVLLMVIIESSIMHFLATGQPENQEQLLEKGRGTSYIYIACIWYSRSNT